MAAAGRTRHLTARAGPVRLRAPCVRRASPPAQGGQQFRLGELEEPPLPFRTDLDKGDMGEAGVGVGTDRLQVGPEVGAARHLAGDLFRPHAPATRRWPADARDTYMDGAYAGLVRDLCVAAAVLPVGRAG